MSNKIEALLRLREYHEAANNTFKREYREWLKLKKYAYVPNLGAFIDNPPDKDDDDFDFWKAFCHKYPGSDNINFRHIYMTINSC